MHTALPPTTMLFKRHANIFLEARPLRMKGSQATECLGQAASIPYDQMLHRCAGQVATAAEVLGSWYFYSAPVFVAIVAFPEAMAV